MSASRSSPGHAGDRGPLIAILLVVLALTFVLVMAERGDFHRFVLGPGNGGVLPDTTLAYDPTGRMPVVTSVRSDGVADRAGLQAGDDIAAIDGHVVRSVSDLRAVVRAAQHDAPLALRVLRGDTTRTVLLVRDVRGVGSGLANGAENSAD